MHIPWATRLMLKVPFATEAVLKFRNFSIDCATKRKARGSYMKDLFYYLVRLLSSLLPLLSLTSPLFLLSFSILCPLAHTHMNMHARLDQRGLRRPGLLGEPHPLRGRRLRRIGDRRGLRHYLYNALRHLLPSTFKPSVLRETAEGGGRGVPAWRGGAVRRDQVGGDEVPKCCHVSLLAC